MFVQIRKEHNLTWKVTVQGRHTRHEISLSQGEVVLKEQLNEYTKVLVPKEQLHKKKTNLFLKEQFAKNTGKSLFLKEQFQKQQKTSGAKNKNPTAQGSAGL